MDIKPKNIFIGFSGKDEIQSWIRTDMGSVLILDRTQENIFYQPQLYTENYASPEFKHKVSGFEAFTPEELIKEDHYQLVKTLNEVIDEENDSMRTKAIF